MLYYILTVLYLLQATLITFPLLFKVYSRLKLMNILWKLNVNSLIRGADSKTTVYVVTV